MNKFIQYLVVEKALSDKANYDCKVILCDTCLSKTYGSTQTAHWNTA